MGLLDVFGGEPGRNAAIWSAGTTQGGAQQQRGYLGQGANMSLAALGKGAAQGRKDLLGQTTGAQNALTAGRDAALAPLNANPDILRQYGNQADAFYAPLGATANAGFQSYADAMGVNGAGGYDRATGSFRTSPGYQFQVNQSTDQAARAAAAAGMAASGNTMRAVTERTQGLADKEWDDYLAHLNVYNTLAPQIAGQRAGIAQHTGDQLAANNLAISGLQSGYGRDVAGLKSNLGGSLASMDTGLGSNQAGIYTGLGQNLSNVTGAETAAITGQGQAGMLAGQQGQQNAINAGLSLAQIAATAAGKSNSIKNPFA
jgi:hypothetical protein